MELGGVPLDDRNAGYIDEDESEIEYSDFEEGDWDFDSSDEEGKWQYLHEKLSGVSGNEDNDDFDTCMENELARALEAYIQGFDDTNTVSETTNSSASVTGTVEEKVAVNKKDVSPQEPLSAGDKPGTSQAPPDEYYNDIYFSSGSSDGEGVVDQEQRKKEKKNKRKKLTNEELLYDPDLDNENQRWINRQRMAYHNVHSSQKLELDKKHKNSEGSGDSTSDKSSPKKKAESTTKLPKSDAILSCPACMSTLCIDCQRHMIYKNQYRAMFVLNCTVYRDEVLKTKAPKKGSKKQRKRRKDEDEDDSGPYHPVKCTICSTEVAVFDKDEVFHFFNVLPSAS